jgi:hypothetical protein
LVALPCTAEQHVDGKELKLRLPRLERVMIILHRVFALIFLFGRINVDRRSKFMKVLPISYGKSRLKKAKYWMALAKS